MHPQSGMVIVLIVFEVYACQSSVRILDKCIQRAVAKEICKVYEDYDKLSVTILAYYIIFHQRSVTHLLLTDSKQQSHFQYFTHGLLVLAIPLYRLH